MTQLMHSLLYADSVTGLPMGFTGGNVSAMRRVAAHLGGGRIVGLNAPVLERSGFLNPMAALSDVRDSACVPVDVLGMWTGWRVDREAAVLGGRGSRAGLGGLVTLWIGAREIYHNALRSMTAISLREMSKKIKKKGARA